MPGVTAVPAADTATRLTLLVGVIQTFTAYSTAGARFGIDRLAMLITESQSIREVIAFPKTQTAACVMMAAPGAVEEQQLRDLHIRLRQPPAKAE